MYPEGSETGYLDESVRVLLCIQANAAMVPNFQVAAIYIACNPPV
jgi:hypothetical protein